jgi:hypothetical protein
LSAACPRLAKDGELIPEDHRRRLWIKNLREILGKFVNITVLERVVGPETSQ